MTMKRTVRMSRLWGAVGVAAVITLYGLQPVCGNDRVIYGASQTGVSRIAIQGTSTLHDWEVEGKTIQGTVESSR